ncbi:MAG: hypothetical protein OEV30_07035 [Ignavibacteria bacterium]|nr:hypothetical protein [Ignavibacteria bacterium]
MKSFLSLLLVLLAGCGPEETSDPERMIIAYNVLVDADADDYDIFTMKMDGSDPTNITGNPDVAWTYLSSGGRILFLSDRDSCARCYGLYSMNPDGSGRTLITSTRLRDSWMSVRKGGTELIVNPHPSVDSSFNIINLSGEVLSRINTGLPYASDPCFSPDGSRIVFRGALLQSKREEGFVDELYMINDDGTGLRQLTHYPEDDTTAPWFAYRAGPPRWNQAENFISYQSFQNGKYSLYAVTPDGASQWKLTDIEMQEGYHDWSPDGKWLAVEVFDQEETQFHVALMNRETKDFRILTDTSYTYQQAPVFVSGP